MTRPIQLTQELINNCVEEFRASISKTKLSGGQLNYSSSFVWEGDKDKAHIIFSTTAFAKTVALVKEMDKEVAWHGLVTRRGDDSTFFISDIITHPQTVTGATVDTDQAEYEKWLMDLDDEVFKKVRLQAHSHVNMAVTPSGTDERHQESIISQLHDDQFYIFMIWNKSMSSTVRVYDLKNNTYYDGADVIMAVEGDDIDIQLGTYLDKPVADWLKQHGVARMENPLEDFIKSAKEMVKTKSYTYNAGVTYGTALTQQGKSGTSSYPDMSKGKGSTSKPDNSSPKGGRPQYAWDDDSFYDDYYAPQKFKGHSDWWHRNY